MEKMKYEKEARWLFTLVTEYLSGDCDDAHFEMMAGVFNTRFQEKKGEEFSSIR